MLAHIENRVGNSTTNKCFEHFLMLESSFWSLYPALRDVKTYTLSEMSFGKGVFTVHVEWAMERIKTLHFSEVLH